MKAEFYSGSYAYGGEISIARFCVDFERMTWATTLSDAQSEYPSYLLIHPNKKTLYAVRELTAEGALYTFEIVNDSLRLIDTQLTLGRDPCYLSLDESNEFLFVVNYTGSSLAVFRLDENGLPIEMTDQVVHTGSGPNSKRQEVAHPHCAVYINGSVYVCDLGMDRIFRYRLDKTSGKLSEEQRIVMPAGSGPRHLCVAGDMMYVIGELISEVYVLHLEDEARIVQEISTLPSDFKGENIAAAIKLSEDGKVLFVSNRGDDSIAAFRILPDGKLELADICKTGGKTPRDFSLFGNHLIIANQDSDAITVLEFDKKQFKVFPVEMILHTIRPTQIVGS